MSAGSSYKWAWADGERYKTPVEMPASQYFETCLRWADDKINDVSLFPVDPGVPFPPSFRKNVSLIFKRFFRLYAHVYYHRTDQGVRNVVIAVFGGRFRLPRIFV